jgi:hypothetical protein
MNKVHTENRSESSNDQALNNNHFKISKSHISIKKKNIVDHI